MKKSAKDFLDAISGNAEIREYLETYQLPEGKDQEDCLMEVAAKFGYECTKEELKKAYAGKAEDLFAPAEKQVEGCDNYQFVMTECPSLIYPPICD